MLNKYSLRQNTTLRSTDIINYLREIVQYISDNHLQTVVNTASDLANIPNNALIWIAKSDLDMTNTCASAILVLENYQYTSTEQSIIKVKDPRLSFVKLVNHFLLEQSCKNIHPTVAIGENCKFGLNLSIMNNVVIGDDEVIGDDVVIGPNTVIYDGTQIGSRVTIGPNCSIGFEGFGFIKDSNNTQIQFPHIGKVLIEDDVDIGAKTCIDRGALSITKIGRLTKIDNFCHIAYNVEIGESCVITAKSTIAGSAKIGNGVWFGPSSTILDKVTVGDNSFIGIGSTVIRNVPSNKKVFGNPAKIIGPNNTEEIF